jgi:glutaredoxin
MRVKAHLAARGVKFDVVDIASDTSALEELRSRNIRAIPVVTLGDKHALGFDLQQVDDLLDGRTASESPVSPIHEVLERACLVLGTAARLAAQLPADHRDDFVPHGETQQPIVLPDGTPMLTVDGLPYIPHNTYIGLVRHIVGHAAKFRVALRQPGSPIFHGLELFAPYGEPSRAVGLPGLVDCLNDAAADARAWVNRPPADELLERSFDTCLGIHTAHWLIESQTVSVAHHTRQLTSLLVANGIEPDRPLDDALYVRLRLSPKVWD